MPIYQYRHPEHPIVIEVLQSMKEPHTYTDDEGTEWVRIFNVPNANIDTKIDPFDSKAFVDSTKDTKVTYGDFLDRSKELSEQRVQKLGYDPVKQKYFDDYSKKCGGKKLPGDPSR